MDNKKKNPEISQNEQYDTLADGDFQRLIAKYATVLSFEKK